MVCTNVYWDITEIIPCLTAFHKTRTADTLCPEEDDDSTILSHWTYFTLYFIGFCHEKAKKRNIIESIVVL